ncbi:Zinc finger BED domain-containing protein 4, partial [Stegodyphus mimosarum]
MLEYSGFKKILNPIVNAIGNHFSVNSENIKLLIPETAVKIVSEISTALEKKVISLKIDIATRLNRSILGINAQLIIGGRINLFTLGMTELKDKHTGIYIKNMVEKVLEKYNIDIQQIYSFTTDNGANIISFVNLLGSEIEDEVIEMENENFETRDHFEDGVFFDHNFSFNKLIGIRCAAHTLQLAIKDSIKNADFNEFISDARGLVKKLRIPSLMLKFNTKKTILDCPTRWNSTYNMLKSLLKCKDFSSTLAEHNLDYYFADSKWVKLKLIVDTLQPLTEATLKLQSEELTLSDFYGIWTHCKIKLRNFKNFFADILYNQLSDREALLIEIDSLVGAVYLDPRYQILLSTSQKVQAVQHLKNIWNKLQFFEKSISIVNEETKSSTESDENEDDLETFLKSKELAIIKTHRTSISTEIDIEFILNNFDNVRRLDIKHNILDFWEENKITYPHLYKIAMVVLAAPATQVSVERAFSGQVHDVRVKRRMWVIMNLVVKCDFDNG